MSVTSLFSYEIVDEVECETEFLNRAMILDEVACTEDQTAIRKLDSTVEHLCDVPVTVKAEEAASSHRTICFESLQRMLEKVFCLREQETLCKTFH